MERTDITLRTADGSNPPRAFEELMRALDGLAPSLGNAAGRYVKAKVDEQATKVALIKAQVIASFQEMENRRLQLIQERDAAKEAAANERLKIHLENHQKHYELRTERFKVIVDSCEKLKAIGADPEFILTIVKRGIMAFALETEAKSVEALPYDAAP